MFIESNHIIELESFLDLGNNYSYEHFINALNELENDSIDSADELEQLVSFIRSCDLSDGIKIIAKGNYGKVELNTCINDFCDFARSILW